jgi:diguanylate cyclase (GGDEF)-like protein
MLSWDERQEYGGETIMNDQENSDDRQAWFLRGLLPKIADVNTALGELMNGKEGAAAELRRQAQYLAETADHYGSEKVKQAAQEVLSRSPELLQTAAEALLKAMSEARAQVAGKATSVLFVGGTKTFVAILNKQLPRELGCIIHVSTAEEADCILQKIGIAAIILHLPLSDDDRGAFFTRLRNTMATATIPVLLLGGPRLTEHLVLSENDACQEEAQDANGVVAWVTSRLRRAHERGRMAWRDRATGLINRASFNACSEGAIKDCAALQEPLTLAVMRLDATVARAAADRVGTLLSEYLRSTDLLARWDTHTFAVLFPGEDQFGATRAIEKIEAIVSKESFGVQGSPPSLSTLTVGITCVSAGLAFEKAVEDAEDCLTKAQAEGSWLKTSTRKRLARRRDNVLLVSADQLLSKVLMSLLVQEQFNVTGVETPHAGVERCQGHRRFQLIIIDENVSPSGREALEALKHLPRNLRVPTVILLKEHSTVRPDDYLASGATVCIERPLNVTTCATQMRELACTNARFHEPSCSVCRVLVVDDDPTQLYLAASALNAHGGFLVFLAKGEDDAARRLREEAFDALIVPDAMIARDRDETFTLRETTIMEGDIGIILTLDSGSACDTISERGIVGFLKKPVEWISLGSTIETMLNLPPTRNRDRGGANDISGEIQRIAVLTASQTSRDYS